MAVAVVVMAVVVVVMAVVVMAVMAVAVVHRPHEIPMALLWLWTVRQLGLVTQ